MTHRVVPRLENLPVMGLTVRKLHCHRHLSGLPQRKVSEGIVPTNTGLLCVLHMRKMSQSTQSVLVRTEQDYSSIHLTGDLIPLQEGAVLQPILTC